MKKRIYFRTGCTVLDKVIGGAKGVYGVPAGRFIKIGRASCRERV